MEWIYSQRIYLEDKIFDGSIGFENGKILELYDGIHPEAKRFDGKRIIPGIIDTHNHGSFGWSMMANPSIEDIQAYLKALASQGVTGIFPTTFPTPNEIGAKNIVEASKLPICGSQILGIHFEGPYLHRVGEKGKPQPKVDIDIDHVRDIINECDGLLKVMGHAPELEHSEKLIALLLENNIKAAITHTNANAEIAKRAINQGITVATHTGNVMTGIHHRDVGTLGMCLIDDRVMCEAICDGMHLSLDMVQLILKTKGFSGVMMISDCTALSGLKPGIYGDTDVSIGDVIIVSEDGFVKTKEGRLVGSSQPLIKGIENLVEKLHYPLEKVLQMSSYNQAKFYALENKGCLKVGNDADFVVIDEDYSVLSTYVLGKEVYKQGVTTIAYKEFM